ncbi:MAG: hypothetical protein Tsb002_26150 [Wenzhouxiangellaceae bacterium]
MNKTTLLKSIGLLPHPGHSGLRLIGLVSLLLGSAHALAQSTTLDLLPSQDNTLYERVAGDVSNGAGQWLFFGRTGPNNNMLLRRALMAFDLSAIPPGSEVLDASLSITVDMVPPMPTGFDATLHRLTTAWGEGPSVAPGVGGSGGPAAIGDATWLHTFFDTDLWSTAGGDFAAQPSATTAIGAGVGTFTFAATPELIADIQAWVNQPASNFGWIILGEENNPQNARRIHSRESTGGNPPLLSIEFIPRLLPPAVAVPALGPGGLTGLILCLFAGAGLLFQRRRSITS